MASLSLGKLPWQGQLGVFLAISLAGAGAFYYFYEMPRQEKIAAQSVELSTIRGRISKARRLPASYPSSVLRSPNWRRVSRA